MILVRDRFVSIRCSSLMVCSAIHYNVLRTTDIRLMTELRLLPHSHASDNEGEENEYSAGQPAAEAKDSRPLDCSASGK